MSGVVFLFAVLMIAVIVVWSILNDQVPMGGRTRGLLAMADEDGDDPEAADGGHDTPGRDPRRAAEQGDRPAT